MQLRTRFFSSAFASSVWFRMASKMDSVFYINYNYDLKIHSMFKYRPVYFIKSKLNKLDCLVSIRSRIKSFFKPRSVNLLLIHVLYFCLGLFLDPFLTQQESTNPPSLPQYGFLLSALSFGICIFLPLTTKLIFHAPFKLLIFSGVFTSGASFIILSCLHYASYELVLITLAFTLRLVQALGTSLVFICSYFVLATSCPDSIGRYFTLIELTFGLGVIISPVFKAILLQFGEDNCFFMVFTGLTILSSILTLFVVTENDLHQFRQLKLWPMFKQFDISFNLIMFLSASFLFGFNYIALFNHVQSANPISVGLISLLNGLSYLLSKHLWNYFCERFYNAHYLSIIGFSFEFFALASIGLYTPTNFNITFDKIICQVLIGCALGAKIMGSFIQAFQEIYKFGFVDDIATYTKAASLFAFAFSLGSGFGMIVGAIFINYFSFQRGSLFVLLIELPIFVFLIIKMTVKYFKHSQFAKRFLPNKDSKREDQTNVFCIEEKNKKFVSLSNFYYLNEDSNKTYL